MKKSKTIEFRIENGEGFAYLNCIKSSFSPIGAICAELVSNASNAAKIESEYRHVIYYWKALV